LGFDLRDINNLEQLDGIKEELLKYADYDIVRIEIKKQNFIGKPPNWFKIVFGKLLEWKNEELFFEIKPIKILVEGWVLEDPEVIALLNKFGITMTDNENELKSGGNTGGDKNKELSKHIKNAQNGRKAAVSKILKMKKK